MRAKNYKVDIMVVMKRVGVKDTIFDESTKISELELTKVAVITRLAVRPKISMNVHEPMKMPILAGINQLYTAIGGNPKDTDTQTKIVEAIPLR